MAGWAGLGGVLTESPELSSPWLDEVPHCRVDVLLEGVGNGSRWDVPSALRWIALHTCHGEKCDEVCHEFEGVGRWRLDLHVIDVCPD